MAVKSGFRVETSAGRRLVLIGLIAILAAGCSASADRPQLIRENDENKRFKVSVTSEGRQIKDYNQSLVHRVEISKVVIDQMIQSWPAPFHKIATTQNEYDSQGKLMGLRVVAAAGGEKIAVLNLVDRDIITAVGVAPIHKENDILALFTELKKTGGSTMTIERSGMPHKFLYYVQSK